MRDIERSTTFSRDYKRESAGQHRRNLEVLLSEVVSALAVDVPLPPANRDHSLTGQWRGYRECHLRPDLLLIYSKPDPETLGLTRLGSQSELFG